MTLTEFLQARIAEDEGDIPLGDCDCFVDTGDGQRLIGGTHGWVCPARVLTECEAKRALLAAYTEAVRYYNDVNPSAPAGEVEGLLTAVRIAATVYADHEDYLQEWKP